MSLIISHALLQMVLRRSFVLLSLHFLLSLQVARLMEMGFSRGDALEALRASNNDLNVATNFLLQH